MCFHIPYYCTILWHLSYISDHPLAHLPVRICPACQLSTVRDLEPGQSVPESSLAANQAEEQRTRKKWVYFPLNSGTQRGLYLAPDLSVDSKVTWRERKMANGIFNHLRLKFFGKQDKGERIQFPPKWISIKKPDYKKTFKKSSCHSHDPSCVEASSHLPCFKLH